MKTKVSGLKCNVCGDTIYSRARHDFHWCSCEQSKDGQGTAIFVDGGFDYFRAGYEAKASYENVDLEVDATRYDLYDDWNCEIDKFGRVKS